ncbi:unnamed protein product [Aphanomyces euteiches]|uniref:FYVE-type domain-containing protein n=1 Tax=Aphanomyces euteiches TaxID=100861 RepID=A0A6G0WX14_9STRA|nr:hypothetical protein Ae201684_010696 [Aphanomyces euteiches]KAH9061462.1 hypothetical protein Ae201684P_020798 [Aphanomyces euteiches]KAH9140976.1 hypothetical protein AeRB84_014802 [Aphanomyces euteiches]
MAARNPNEYGALGSGRSTRRGRTSPDTSRPTPPPPSPFRSLVDRGPANRSKWPWAFLHDLPSTKDSELLECMRDIVEIFLVECTARVNEPVDISLTTRGPLVSKYSQRRQLFTAHAVVDIAATFDEVKDLVMAPDDGFLHRIFNDNIQLSALSTIYAEEPSTPGPNYNGLQVYASCRLMKVLFCNPTQPKDLLFLDHVQSITSTAMLRVFKSVDNNNYPTLVHNQVVPRHTHIMGGYLIEALESTTSVRVTYYAEHAVYPKLFPSSLDTRTCLEKLGLGIPKWQQAVVSYPPRSRGATQESICRICAKSFNDNRRSSACTMCGAVICPECGGLDSSRGAKRQLPVCMMCLVQVRAEQNGSSALALAMAKPQIITKSNPPSSAPSSRRSPCQLCDRPSHATCAICGQPHCNQCADTTHANVVCYVCSTKPQDRHPILLLDPADRTLRLSDDHQRDTVSSSLPSSSIPRDTNPLSDEDLMTIQSLQQLQGPVGPQYRSSNGSLQSRLSTDGATSVAAATPSEVSDAWISRVCLDMESNDAYDALCEQAMVDMECTNAYVVLMYKGQFQLKGAAGTSYVPATIPGSCEFCTKTVATPQGPLIVPDAAANPIFQNSSRVKGKERVRFYYGLPVRTSSGQVIGTVAVVDTAPRMRVGRSHEQVMVRFAADVVDLVCRRIVDK